MLSSSVLALRRRRRPAARVFSGPREREVLRLLRTAAGNAADAGTLLVELFDRWDDRAAVAARIRDLEHRGDDFTHDILGILNRAYALPFDREDVHGMATAIDDVVDYIEEVADLIGLYGIEAPMDQARELAGIVRDAARAVARATGSLEDPPAARPHLETVRDLEHEGDRVVRGALVALFDHGIDPMAVIRWKDLFDRLEEAVDACKTVANQLDTIMTKHA